MAPDHRDCRSVGLCRRVDRGRSELSITTPCLEGAFFALMMQFYFTCRARLPGSDLRLQANALFFHEADAFFLNVVLHFLAERIAGAVAAVELG